jgi:hypothetical protein
MVRDDHLRFIRAVHYRDLDRRESVLRGIFEEQTGQGARLSTGILVELIAKIHLARPIMLRFGARGGDGDDAV